MNKKRNSDHMDTNHLIAKSIEKDDMASDNPNTDLVKLFELFTLNDRFDLVVVPKTKRAKNDNLQNTNLIYAEDRMEKKIIRLEQLVKDLTKKINILNTLIHDQYIMKEYPSYIN